MRLLVRIYCFLFQLTLALFLTAVGLVTVLSGLNNLHLGMLPWEGAHLTYGVLGLGLGGLVITALAILGRLKLLFPLWCGAVLVLMFRGFFLSSNTFKGPEQFFGALLLTLGALGAFLGSWTVLRRPKPVTS